MSPAGASFFVQHLMSELGGVRERPRQITALDCLTLTVVADNDVRPPQARGTTRWKLELPEEPAMAVCKRNR